MKAKATRFWVILISILFSISAAASFIVYRTAGSGLTANIYQQGELVYSIDLTKIDKPYYITISGAVQNTVLVEKGRISISEATCPDQVCVYQGWISTGVVPIVCLPNGLVIRIENAPEARFDAIAR